ncbi:helix-turn-helix domain-containing protein [Halomicroarcula sp. F13]|uniref:Helix-turn-helix domain-containing protein n=1 Tax=Haloarcula rubra TaxID=2487747 RepID=A0AAW4PPD0_9EURY|nr:helix-turn-helix domain-containing protein [Halomicroarcula rubra]MBX0323035.1 helix-turn-helix domain-containing protein [Halomicroarcula rubra]
MSGDDPPDQQAMFEALADSDCRSILATLDDPLPAKRVADVCELPLTSTYRKLEQLSDAALVAEGTEVRADGHHETTYVRDCTGVFVALDGDDSFDVDVLRDRETPDERLARLWSRVSEEL